MKIIKEILDLFDQDRALEEHFWEVVEALPLLGPWEQAPNGEWLRYNGPYSVWIKEWVVPNEGTRWRADIARTTAVVTSGVGDTVESFKEFVDTFLVEYDIESFVLAEKVERVPVPDLDGGIGRLLRTLAAHPELFVEVVVGLRSQRRYRGVGVSRRVPS